MSAQNAITIIGAGLAGCEAAWQLAKRGHEVTLREMKPGTFSPAHRSPQLAELVCSNSLRSNERTSAVGLLKEELRRLDSLIMTAADATSVPAGKALAVDRLIARKMGFDETYPVTGQTYPRKMDTRVLQVLSGIAQSASKFAYDIRVLQSMEEVEEPFDVEIERASIKVATVEGEILDGNIAYVKIRSFSDQTDEDLRSLLEELLTKEPAGLIIDLRNNPGGLLRTAVSIASEFLPEGVVLYEEYGDGSRDVHEVIRGGLATEIPLVLLVNEYSASASEVVAGAIQDYGRGILIGETTYGKGSVQQIIELSNEQGAVRLTIARWLTPKERLINEIGLVPEIQVEMTDEHYENDQDPQLEKALEDFKNQ